MIYREFNLFNDHAICVKKATPRLIQCEAASFVGVLIIITKLVEWPVVLRTPCLSCVLYSGVS